MMCSLANTEKDGYACPGSTEGNCDIFLPEGVDIRNKRGECNFKSMRNPKKVTGDKKKVNPLKASKRK